MDIAVIWKECVLCDAHYRQDELKEHMKLWHAESSINEWWVLLGSCHLLNRFNRRAFV